MSSVREYLRSITLPWFFRKKFLVVFGIIILVATVIGALFSWQLYNDAIEHGRTVRWKKVTEPLAFPLLFLMLYAIVVLLWIAIKLKEFQGAMLRNIPAVFSPQEIQLEAGEAILAEVTITTRQSPGEIARLGVLRITNQRILHTQTISHKRVGTLVGLEEPNLNHSIPVAVIRQCGFGITGKDEKHFVVIERNGTTHVFGNVKAFEVESALKELNWKHVVVSGFQ